MNQASDRSNASPRPLCFSNQEKGVHWDSTESQYDAMGADSKKNQILDRVKKRAQIAKRNRYRPLLTKLWSRLMEAHSQCKLGEGHGLRRGQCSACPLKFELEIDRAVAQLISKNIFTIRDKIPLTPYPVVNKHLIKYACPYHVVSEYLFTAINFGSVASQESHEHDGMMIAELKTALNHIKHMWRTINPDTMSEFSDVDPRDSYFASFKDIRLAEYKLANALSVFEERYAEQSPELPAKTGRGPRGLKELQDIAVCTARLWKKFTGRFPGKNNVQFHDLLRAATITVFGMTDEEPNWEWATRSAVQRLKGQEESRQNDLQLAPGSS